MKLRNLRYLNLLVVIIVMMVIAPFVQKYPAMRIVNSLVLTLVMLSVVNTVRGRKVTMAIGLYIGVPWLVIAWLNGTGAVSVHPAVPALLSTLFEGYVIFMLFDHIARARRVTADIIYGAISVYLLLGLFFASIYHFLGSVYGEGLFIYAGPARPGTGVSLGDLYYFSYVTLTTLGYGDIQPVTELARTFSIIEAMTGVLYSAVLIGRLIGMYVAQYGGSEALATATSRAASAAAAAARAAAAPGSAEARDAAGEAAEAASDAAEAAEAVCSGGEYGEEDGEGCDEDSGPGNGTGDDPDADR